MLFFFNISKKFRKELKQLQAENRNLTIIYKVLTNPLYQLKDQHLENDLKIFLHGRQEINELINVEKDKKEVLEKNVN
jgi:hypothetical protein